MNKYCTKVKLRAAIGETQSSHCQRITSQTNDSKRFPCNVTKMKEDFLRKFCSYVCYLDISGSLKILDSISVILSAKVRKNMIPIPLLAFHPYKTLVQQKASLT